MARSMIQRRQEAARERTEAYDATLKRVARAARPAPDFNKALAEARGGFVGEAIRDPAAWRPRMKSRDPARLRLAAARHLYARYPVSGALERIWIDAGGLDVDEVRLRKSWYVIAARGGSLYKEAAGRWLTRKEVHRFLNPPGDLSFEAAFWQAVARSYTDDLGLALSIARTKVAHTPRRQFVFWREVVRFFCANPAPRALVDDLVDYLAACRRHDRRYSLKGRTLAALERQMHEWHRDLATIARIEAARRRAWRAAARAGMAAPEGGRWDGSALADWSWKPSAKEPRARREEYVVRQLSSAAELVAETRAMRHCVSTYAAKCIAGSASIWSLSRRGAGKTERLLTIELDRCDRLVQVRGFANRPPLPDEQKVLARWAKARGVLVT
ncbi:MAG: PcfJ domain-containing protein [Nitratireductor sp.]